MPDADIEVNGVLEGAIPSVSTADIQVTDGVAPVTPTSVVVSGNTVTIEVPSGGGAPVGATLMRTGQTTIYRTGDDADRSSEGRATDFFTLASNNPFGNLNRFTDELGTQTYTNNIVIDWSTYDGSTVLGYYRLRGTYSDIAWNDAIDNSLLFTKGTYTTGWRLPNIKELLNLADYNSINPLNYAPFNFAANLYFWSSTTNAATPSNALVLHNRHSSIISDRGKANTSIGWRAIPCRTFTVTGTILT